MTFAEIDDRSLCIFVEKLPDGRNHALGTGCFFIRRDLVLTARHVLDKVVQERSNVFIANGSNQEKLFGARPKLFFPHPKVDLALVKVSEEDLHIDRPLFPAHFPLNKKSGAIAIGYNREASTNAANSWVLTANKVSDFSVQERERSEGSLEYVLDFSAPWMTPGCSGGPIITLGGGVVAVMIETFVEQDDFSVVAPQAHGRATSVYPIMDCFRSPFEGTPVVAE